MLTYHTAIIGAGAGGLFCAGSFNRPKIILDHNAKPGVKVGVSGGGKCNFTNLFVSAADYDSQSKHFCKNALAAFKPADFVRLLDQARIPYEQRENGQLFAQKAQDIVNFLVSRAKAAHTDFSLNTEILDVQHSPDGFLVRTSAGLILARHVVLACGGVSYPALGASPLGIKLARRFGLSIIEQRPALCGFILPKEWRTVCKTLAGNSTLAEITTGKHTFTGQLLFTHEGISGPAVLSASLFWREGQPVTVNLLPNLDVADFLYQHKGQNRPPSALLPLTGHIAKTWLGPLDQPLANAPKTVLEQIISRLSGAVLIVQRTAGYTKAEVTAGGIDTREVNPTTFEIKKWPGLYAIGELLDVTGRLGGFNLHWAWASGYSAAAQLNQKI